MSKKRVVIMGVSGGIGSALLEQIKDKSKIEIFAFSKSEPKMKHENICYSHIDYNDVSTIQSAAEMVSKKGLIDLIIVATGFLHNENIWPEKSLRDLNQDSFEQNFLINTIGPALIAKYFLPLLNKNDKSIFAILSARVGSITDNRLGGWYSYRMSKAAINMFIKTTSIEMARKNKEAIILGLHPGTVYSQLSTPFQSHVPAEKLFTTEYSASCLLKVLDGVTINDSGKIIAWDGSTLPY
jgi:NAD(P)-dependent dehydrogenase (short-subunit alcohol dehydrogenase family)